MKTQKKTPAKGFQKLYAFQVRGEIDLSVSENPLGCSPLVVDAFQRLEPHFNDYPDPQATALRKALAVFFRCQPDNVLIGNGSESIIPILFRMFVGSNEEVIVPQLTFPMFTFTGELLKTSIIHAPMTNNLGINLREIEKRITAATKMIIVCNPNNPTGAVISRRELMAFLDRVPKNIVVVIDEANIEFGGKSVLPLALHFPNVLVLRTFSKAFGLAALRVGCLVGESQLIQKIREQFPVFPVTAISQQLAIVALQDQNFLKKTKQFITEQRKIIARELSKLGFTVFPSQANNLFIKLPENMSAEEFCQFLETSSISLVKGESFPGMNNTFFRISPRDEKTNQLFLSLLRGFAAAGR